MDAQRPIYPRRVPNSELDFVSIENGCTAFDLPPEGPKKERWAISATLQNNSKVDFGSIENGSAAFDLPPEGQKKER